MIIAFFPFGSTASVPESSPIAGAIMNLRFCSLGLIVLAGCAGTSDSPKATAPPEPSAQSASGGRNNISVPNMT